MFVFEKKYINLIVFSKYFKVFVYFLNFFSAWSILLKSLAFLVLIFNVDLKMLYFDFLKKTVKNVKIRLLERLVGEICIICEIYL